MAAFRERERERAHAERPALQDAQRRLNAARQLVGELERRVAKLEALGFPHLEAQDAKRRQRAELALVAKTAKAVRTKGGFNGLSPAELALAGKTGKAVAQRLQDAKTLGAYIEALEGLAPLVGEICHAAVFPPPSGRP